MMNFDYITKHNPNWPQNPDHPYGILITGGSGSVKTKSLFNLLSYQLDKDKIYLYAIDRYDTKYQFIIKVQKKCNEIVQA